MGETVNKERLSKIVGISLRTLTEYQKEGMPIKTSGKRGQSNTYDTQKVIAWLIRRASNSVEAMDRAKLRLMEAQAEIAELNVQEKREEMMHVDTMKLTWASLFGTCRSRILSLPSRLAPALATQSNAVKIEKILSDACNEALIDMADYDSTAYQKTGNGRQGSAKNSSAAASA